MRAEWNQERYVHIILISSFILFSRLETLLQVLSTLKLMQTWIFNSIFTVSGTQLRKTGFHHTSSKTFWD